MRLLGPAESTAPPIHVAAFKALDRMLVVRSEAPEIIEYLNAVYHHLRTEGPSSGAIDTGRIGGADAEPWLFFNDEPVEHRETGADTTFRRAFYGSGTLFRRSLRLNAEWHSLYGAALRLGDRAILISAQSGIGKTTLALELMRRGAKFYSDELAFVHKRDRLVSGLPRTLMIRERTFSVFDDPRLVQACRASTPRAPYGDRVWDTIDPAAVFGDDIFASPAPLAATLLLERTSSTTATVERLAAGVAAADLTQRLNTATTGFPRFSDAAAIMSGVPCFRIAARSPQAAADALEGLLA
ncbi:MAG: hypothetical protein M3Z37_01950 [Candidatus Eremiobacteraeota bacterium]|nr:hypothetical protein [Candidatus Eremiobacteraeota bacterium]